MGFTMPSGTGTAPAIPLSTVLVAPPTATVSSSPPLFSTESDPDDAAKEAAKPEENPGLSYSSAPVQAVSSTPAAVASQTASTSPASPSSSGEVSYAATFTEYVVLCSSTYLPPCPSIKHTDATQIWPQRRQRFSQLQRRHRLLRLLQHPRVQRGRFSKPVRCRVGQDRHLRYLLATRPGIEPQRCRSDCIGDRAEFDCRYGEQPLPGIE